MGVSVNKIIKAYAKDPEGLTLSECLGEGLTVHQCGEVSRALSYGAGGEITADERKRMEEARISKEFIDGLAGTDGRKALNRRVKWLAESVGDIKSEKTQIKFLEEIGNAGDLSVVSSLVEKLGGNYGPEAAEALVNIGIACVPTLINVFKDNNMSPAVLRHVAWALGMLKDRRAVPALIGCLSHSSPIVRYSMVWALSVIGDPAAIPAIIEALITEEYVDSFDFESVARFGKNATTYLIDVLMTDKRNKARFVAVKVLEEIKDADALPVLIKALWDKSEWIRRNVVTALGRIGDRMAAPALIRLLDSEDSQLRWNAALALGSINDPRAIAPLIKKLKADKEGWEAPGFTRALEMMDASVIWPLVNEMEHGGTQMCVHAAWILSHMDKEISFLAVPMLDDVATKHSDPLCRNSAKETLNFILNNTL